MDACPRLEVVKRSVCIEGARRAFARVKLQWVKLDAVKLIKEGPPEGKEHRHPEMYYEGVLPGARLIANECSQDVLFEWDLLVLSCMYENLYHVRYATLVRI